MAGWLKFTINLSTSKLILCFLVVFQPDSESSLCTYPFCTTIFSQPRCLTLGPRRHHCRMCGRLFCASHSSRRALLLRVDHKIVKERVCDLCYHPSSSDEATTIISSNESRRNSLASSPTDAVLTPISSHDDAVPLTTPLSLCNSASSRQLQELSEVQVEPSLAPIEPWMDSAGVLSLYPLAQKPSIHPLRPAVAPLFAPSRSRSRKASLERNVKNDDLWIPGTWGYRREDFDLSCRDEEGDDFKESVGGLVVDGPIRFRAERRATGPAGKRTPHRERRALSTF